MLGTLLRKSSAPWLTFFMVSGLGGYRRVLTRFAFFSFIEIVKTVQTCKITGNLTAKRQEYGSAAKN